MPFWADLERLEHLGLGDLQRAALDHQDRVGAAAHRQVQGGELQLLEGRVEDPVALDPAHPHRGDRAVPRHRRDAESAVEAATTPSTSASFSWSAEMTVTKTWTSFLKPSGKSGRIDRSITRAARISLSLRPAFALEEPARDLARGVGLLAILDREGEERQRWTCWGRR